jgi:hypothetical protein
MTTLMWLYVEAKPGGVMANLEHHEVEFLSAHPLAIAKGS